MFRNIFLFFLLLIFFSCAPKPVVKENRLSASIKIISVNLHQTLNSKTETTKFVKKIKNINPEIILVQQINRPGYGGGFDAVKEFAKQLDMRSFYSIADDQINKSSGNAIFSMYPIMQTAEYKFSNPKRKKQHSLAFGIIDVGVKSLGVISTELVNNSKENREVQLKELNSFISKNSVFPIFLGGSFYEKLDDILTNKSLTNVDGIKISEEQNARILFTNYGLKVDSAEEIFKDCIALTLTVIQ